MRKDGILVNLGGQRQLFSRIKTLTLFTPFIPLLSGLTNLVKRYEIKAARLDIFSCGA